MKHIFEYLVRFFDLLSKAGTKRQTLAFVGICYFLITVFDLLGLGAVFFFISQFLGVKTSSSVDVQSFLPMPDWMLLLAAIPMIWFIKFCVVLLANRAIIRFSQDTAANLRQQIIYASFNAEYPRNEVAQMATWTDTLSRQLSYAASGIIEPTLRALCDLFLLLLVCAYLLWLVPATFLMLAGWLIMGMIISDLAIRRVVRNTGYVYTVTSENLTREFNEIALGFKEFWSLKSSKFFHQRIKNKLDLIITNYVSFAVLSMAPRLFLEMLLVSGIVLIILISEIMGFDQQKILLSITIVGVGAIRLIPLISSVNLGINQLRSGYRTMENVLLFDTQTSARPKTPQPRPIVCLHLEEISKCYDQQIIFHSLDADINRGQCTVIFGPSGCGKTTLADVIAGLLPPSSGQINVSFSNGEIGSLKDIDLKIGYVAQFPSIVDGTVFENLTLSNKLDSHSHDQAKLTEAMKLSRFVDVLDDLPNGLMTHIGDGHQNLSGGQLQKLALCRAVYLSDDMLILDEPTSALDAESESRFVESLSALKENRILIIVTHSRRVMAAADRQISFTKRGVLAALEK